MNKRKILLAKNKIELCKKQKNSLEALLRLYHLNFQLLCFLLESSIPNLSLQHKKNKEVLALLTQELEINPQLKTLINKKNSKPVKIWLRQMDTTLKAMKHSLPKNTLSQINQGEAVFLLLNISANKLFVK